MFLHCWKLLHNLVRATEVQLVSYARAVKLGQALQAGLEQGLVLEVALLVGLVAGAEQVLQHKHVSGLVIRVGRVNDLWDRESQHIYKANIEVITCDVHYIFFTCAVIFYEGLQLWQDLAQHGVLPHVD